jgi:pimeloyl-ACP methyl ester carboxylesterase
MSKISRIILPIAWLCLLLSACGTRPTQEQPTSTPVAKVEPTFPTTGVPRFEEATCQVENYQQLSIKCGFLIVPEDRLNGGERTIKLSVAVINSGSGEPKKDPLVITIFGPGGQVRYLNGIAYLLNQVLSERELIVMDQRGTGFSDPVLECPEVRETFYNTLEQAPFTETVIAQTQDAYRACRSRLVASGVNLEYYTTSASAMDLEDLHNVLGLKEFNVYGLGYGGRLALQWARLNPQGLRSLILDSAIPPDADLFVEQVNSVGRNLELFFERCAGDGKCKAAYPDLETVFYQDVEKLNMHVVEVNTADLQEGKRYNLSVNGDRLIDLTLALVGSDSPDLIAQLPQMIYQVRDGKYDTLATLLSSYIGFIGPDSSGMQVNIFCAEELTPAINAKIADAIHKAPPGTSNYLNHLMDANYSNCEAWNGKAVSTEEKKPVSSGVPTLLLAADNGPLDPATWQAEAQGTLSKSRMVTFSAAGYGVLGSYSWLDCWRQVTLGFITDPGAMLDSACTQEQKNISWITFSP